MLIHSKSRITTNTRSYASYPSHLEATSIKLSSEHCKERLRISCFNIASRSEAAGAGSCTWKSNLPENIQIHKTSIKKDKLKRKGSVSNQKPFTAFFLSAKSDRPEELNDCGIFSRVCTEAIKAIGPIPHVHFFFSCT